MRKCNSWSRDGILPYTLFWLLLYCTHVKAQVSGLDSTSPSMMHEVQSQDITCKQGCQYDESFQRAFCEERNFSKVPSSEGCEDTMLLELQGNHLTNISEESFLGYTHLKTLNLNYNDITMICPGVFSNTKHLKNILINNNQIMQLQNGTFKGPQNHLLRIFLNKNKIADIHENVFHGLKALSAIYLSYNRIQYLPPSIFHGLDRLQDIIIGYNKIDHLDAFIFKDLISLESVSLRNNKLKWLPNGLFHGLSSLREVVLSNNELVLLPSPQNLGITSLQRLYLDNNNFSQSESIIPYFHLMDAHFDISDNPFMCDCAFITIQEWYNNKSKESLNEYSVMCTLGDFKYHLEDTLPISCKYPTENTVSSIEPKDEQTSTIHLNSHGGGASEVTSFTKENFPANDHARQLSFNQYCSKDTTDMIILIASVYSAVCFTVFLILWICYKCHCCFPYKENLRQTEKI